ncbi:hypothetical protein DSLASN_27090 [Desulfoluna limicola]|uniref:DUF3533 domain-containing protein n=1 Tax=Desulfoluna limicola TaxID=2810562 RepID=A0ABN6F3Q5_9BACT|nr:hypothetical protein [Desulfoluna limicola]BCS97077.1 hypothetical protein DSLASN_27090 [Desulfoluna limicola]
MNFFLKRLSYRLASHLALFWLLLLPPLVYVGIMALTPTLHTLSSTFTVPEGAPLAETGSPTGVTPLATLLSTPSKWESFVKANFNPQQILGYPRGYVVNLPPDEINAIYNEALTNLSIREANKTVETTYTGPHKTLGHRLVFYYSTTLHQRIQEGYTRQGSKFTSPLGDAPQMTPLIGATRLLWSPDRARPTLLWFAAGLILLLFIQAVLELMDTSYKSEKQIAEHTLLPILGCLPNLNSVPMSVDAPQHQEA